MLLFLIINVKRLLDILRTYAYNDSKFNILRYDVGEARHV